MAGAQGTAHSPMSHAWSLSAIGSTAAGMSPGAAWRLAGAMTFPEASSANNQASRLSETVPASDKGSPG